MLRKVHLSIISGMLLTACVVVVYADTAKANPGAFAENRQLYSNRPIGFARPNPYFGTPMAPRFMVPPATPAQFAAPVARVTPIAPITPIHLQATWGNQVPNVAMQPPMQQPMMAPSLPMMTPAGVPPTMQDATTQVVRETTVILREPSPEVSVHDQLDAFHARLARIHLERRQLPEALALIANIRSDTFKVRTLVDLAEYVSRDATFRNESDQLFRLALAGIDALGRGQPVRIDIGGVNVVQPVVAPQIVPQQPPPATIFSPVETIIVPQPIDDNGYSDTPLPVTPDNGVAIPPIVEVPLNDGESIRRNGRDILPPPPPPDRNGNGVVFSPPGIQPPPTLHPLEQPPPEPSVTEPPAIAPTLPQQQPTRPRGPIILPQEN